MTPRTDSARLSLRPLGSALRRWAGGDGGSVGVVRMLERHGLGTVESGQIPAGTAAGALVGTDGRIGG